MRSDGAGPQAPIDVAGFTPSSRAPILASSNTGEVKIGDIGFVSFAWTYAGSGKKFTSGNFLAANRVTALSPNSSMTLAGNLDSVSPGESAAATFEPICPGDNGTGTGQAADGWKKSGTLVVWADDFAANLAPGALRVMGIRKGSPANEYLNWTVAGNKLRAFQGQTVTFGALIFQKSQAGRGTWTLSANDGDQTVTSNSGLGASGRGYQFLSVTLSISRVASRLSLQANFAGAQGDIYYVALPTAVFGRTLSQDDLGQNPNDVMRPVSHWNPPLLTPLQIKFPTHQTPPNSGQYGWSGIDLEAISLGVVHNSVSMVKAKIEWTTATVGAYILTGARIDYSLVFGPETVTNVAGAPNVGSGWLPLADDGTFCIFSNVGGLVPESGTFDFDLVQFDMASSAN
jgi:hypothetical protein